MGYGDARVRNRILLVTVLLPWVLSAQDFAHPPRVLPVAATQALAASLKAVAPHKQNVWRDTPPTNADGTVNGYIEIAKGDRRKWEFEMAANRREIDRMMPPSIGGYPVNYGFVPQTISYDGDPFDVLVLGPSIDGGTVVRGVAVGVMFMEDEKGLDSKVVLSRVDGRGRPLHTLTSAVQDEIGGYFKRYKLHEPGAFSRVPGWGTAAQGLSYVTTTHAFFRTCAPRAGAPCQLN